MEGYIQEYIQSEEDGNKLENNFRYHAPFGTQATRYNHIRECGRELAVMLTSLCPKSRELSLALTKLEESIMWANASIARNEIEKLGE